MASIIIHHRVKDFAAWKKVFDSAVDLRASYGELSAHVFRDASEPNKLTVLNHWNSMDNAQKFANSPELRAAMEQAGVEGLPEVHFLNEV